MVYDAQRMRDRIYERDERELVPGDHVRVGQHLFRLDFGTGSKSR